MTSPNAVFTELVTTTYRDHKRKIADAFTNNNALLKYMMKGGRKRMVDGGLSIVTPLEYAENSTYQRYSGLDPLNIQESDILTAAQYEWRQAAVNVVSSGLELRTNKGRNQIINLAKTRLQNAIKTAKNNFSFDVYSDGTLTNQIDGLQKLISVTPEASATIGGINQADWAMWQNFVNDSDAKLGNSNTDSWDSTNIQAGMRQLHLRLVRGDDAPNLIVTDWILFDMYESSLVTNQRYTNSDEADGSFAKLMFKNIPVIFDGGSGIPDRTMYFLNTDYLELVVHPDADWTMVEEKTSVNQDGVVRPIIFQGNLTCSNRKLQGVLVE
jgi:hypothetical protein